jgi:hypothetical protein
MAFKVVTAALIVAAALIVGAGAVGACFTWSASFTSGAWTKAPGFHFSRAACAANPQEYFELLRKAGAKMKAPGAAGFHISREAFEANPQQYFELLRKAGPKAAAGAFAAAGNIPSSLPVLAKLVKLAVCFV